MGGALTRPPTRSPTNHPTGQPTTAPTEAVFLPPVISKLFASHTIVVGSTTTLTFTIVNPNIGGVTGVSFDDGFPLGLLVATPANVTNTCGGTVNAFSNTDDVQLVDGVIGPLGSCTISVDVQAVTVGELENGSGPVSSNEGGTGNTALDTLTAIDAPSTVPSEAPTTIPSTNPSATPSEVPSQGPSTIPSVQPSASPSLPTGAPLATPSASPTAVPCNTWALVASMHDARVDFPATLLPNGNVLVVGGDGSAGILNTAEIYDPIANMWNSTPPMNVERDFSTATLLNNGAVLVAGGTTSGPVTATSEIYNGTNWVLTGPMNVPHERHTATLLPNGFVAKFQILVLTTFSLIPTD